MFVPKMKLKSLHSPKQNAKPCILFLLTFCGCYAELFILVCLWKTIVKKAKYFQPGLNQFITKLMYDS